MKITFQQADRKTLRRYDVSEQVFDDILQNMATRIQITDNIQQYYCGYKPKHIVMYDNKEYLIIREHLLAYFANFSDEDYQIVEDWRQVIVRKTQNAQEYEKSVDGSRAYKVVKNIICEHISEEQYEKRLRMFEADYDSSKAQFHFQYPSKGYVLQHSNCVKYDINGAHHSALIEIFPEAKDALSDMFARRKAEPILKAYINYYVGMLTRKGHRKTYNWIVQRVSNTLKAAMNECGGDLIYANTDGFMVSNPEKKLKHSKELGEFKIEFEGTAYTYQDQNYWCYQAGDEIKGSVRYSVRDELDLAHGEVVHYTIRKEQSENGVIVQTLTNIEKEHVNVYKEN